MQSRKDGISRRLRKRMHAGSRVVRAWPLTELPRWAIVFIVVVTAVYLAAVGLGAATVHVSASNALLFARPAVVHHCLG